MYYITGALYSKLQNNTKCRQAVAGLVTKGDRNSTVQSVELQQTMERIANNNAVWLHDCLMDYGTTSRYLGHSAYMTNDRTQTPTSNRQQRRPHR